MLTSSRATTTGRVGNVLGEMGLSKLLEGFGVPCFHEGRRIQVAHQEIAPYAAPEAAGGKVSFAGDVAFGEDGPARQRFSHGIQSAWITGLRSPAMSFTCS
jgi:hypothetical protein